VKPNDPNTLFIGGTNLYRSTTAFADSINTTFIGGYEIGATLPVVDNYLNHHPDQHELFFLPSDPNTLFSTNDGGIFKTTDNSASTVAWTPLNNGYLSTQFYTCALDHADTDAVIIGGAQDNGSWFTNSWNPSTPWITPRSGDGSYCAIADNKSAYYFSIQNGKMMRAKLNPAGVIDSFARIDPIGGDSDYVFINPYIIDPNNNNIMYLAGGKHLWRNDDLSGIPYASNWDSITTNWTMFPDTLPAAGMKITALAVSTIPANRLYYGTSNQQLYRIDNANSGTPARTNITGTVSPNNFPNGANISSVAVDPSNANNIMVSFSNYNVYSIFYSDDGGTTWQKVAGNLEAAATGLGNGPSVRCVRIMPVAGGNVYLAATSTGIYATSLLDGLNTVWTQLGTGTIGNAICDMIDFRQTDGLVVVATHGHGIFTANILDVNDIVSVTNITANKLNALRVFPNPAVSGTTIKYTLEKGQHIKLELLDELGRMVKVLQDAKLNASTYEFYMDRMHLNSGLYYIRLTGEKSLVSKLVIQ
jgi:hypothetical protein